MELKSVVKSTPSFLDNTSVFPLNVLPVTNVSWAVAALIIDSTSLYFINPVELLLANICVKVSSWVMEVSVRVKPLVNINSLCTVIGEQPYMFDVCIPVQAVKTPLKNTSLLL